MIKPDDAIYQKLFELFSLKPEECLFFDDKQENIDGAVRNKMNGHVFTSYEDAMNTIKNMPKRLRRLRNVWYMKMQSENYLAVNS